MKAFNVLFVTCLLLFSVRSLAQKIGVDSKGKSVFTHLSSAEARFELSTEEPLSVSYLFHPTEHPFTLTRTGDTTVVKIHGWLGQLSLLNSSDILVLSDLSDSNLGVGGKFGYQSTIDVFHDLNSIPSGYLGTYTWGVNGVLNMDNIRLYDSVSANISKERPVTLGAEGNFNLFFKNWSGGSARMVFAFTGAILHTWNDDELINYQELSKTTVLPTIVALKDFKGRYGTLDRDVTKIRFSLAVPMYFSIVNPIPYLVFNSSSGNDSYTYGAFINVISKRLTKIKFKIPSSIGMGIDWTSTDGDVSDPKIFVKGAISLGKL
ncbi:hypothetical protein [Chryseolinea soli]|uniref:DUF5723 domain-containing protein n=1 Tax=Chryseolinea soli TaxID=2321403 RepID=A0A385SXT2_9BACT|nr:hypothetical protein [Chryseolinea soli]AYB34887.1 hypothetical protein D4L85_31805 [Chryseolinea soli]